MKEIFLGENKFKLQIDGLTGLPFGTFEGSSEEELQSIIFNTLGCEAFNEGFDGGFRFYMKNIHENSWIAKIFLLDIKLLTISDENKIYIIENKMKNLYKEIWG